MVPRDDITPALSEAKRRRATLHEALVALELAVASPAAAQEWTAAVTKEMVGVRDAFDQHVFVTEKPEGLYDEITARAPRLENTIKRLKAEHPPLHEQIESMLEHLATLEEAEARASAAEEVAPSVDETRQELEDLWTAMMRHRQRGSDLVWEAYNVDIGGPE